MCVRARTYARMCVYVCVCDYACTYAYVPVLLCPCVCLIGLFLVLGILAATFMHYVGSVASNALIGDRDIGLKMIICDVPNSCANIEGRI